MNYSGQMFLLNSKLTEPEVDHKDLEDLSIIPTFTYILIKVTKVMDSAMMSVFMGDNSIKSPLLVL